MDDTKVIDLDDEDENQEKVLKAEKEKLVKIGKQEKLKNQELRIKGIDLKEGETRNGYTKAQIDAFPTIGENPDKKIFRCHNCTTSKGEVWISWNDAIKVDPSADDDDKMTATLLLCPYCENTLGTGTYSKKDKVNPDFNPKNKLAAKVNNYREEAKKLK